MPNGLWCQSDPIVKLSTDYGHARLRLLIGSDDSPETPPSDKIIMDLTVPQGVNVAVLKDKDDPHLPTSFGVTHDDAEADSQHQLSCMLFVETPEELDESTLQIKVIDQHKHVLASGSIGPDDDTSTELSFVATLHQESQEHTQALDEGVHTDTSTWS